MMTRIQTPLPAKWFDAEPLLGDDETVRAVLRNPGHELTQLVRETPVEDGLRMAAALDIARGDHARFSYPVMHGALHAVTMLALWMGLSGNEVHEHLGGTATIVRSGLGHRHDQDWHIDSTPWRRPNIWTLLGQIHLADGIDSPPTGLLPVSTIVQALAETPQALHALRSTPIPWRRNFPDHTQFSAPILGLDAPRWVGSVIESLRPEFDNKMAHAVRILERYLRDLPSIEATIRPGCLLIFDNRANLHRGPRIEQSFERQLVRIKLGGFAN